LLPAGPRELQPDLAEVQLLLGGTARQPGTPRDLADWQFLLQGDAVTVFKNRMWISTLTPPLAVLGNGHMDHQWELPVKFADMVSSLPEGERR